jgi:hypothetical protein
MWLPQITSIQSTSLGEFEEGGFIPVHLSSNILYFYKKQWRFFEALPHYINSFTMGLSSFASTGNRPERDVEVPYWR